ncbi:MAG: cob(I)yrinic acid a,c-diamide adenosyltransferase [Cyclobacteriaceae bacterium]|jgi:cob(I)alamin adenosyltransferase|nr:cob(I)yrinic acid a,c-diamide adenosyltransferase [Cyclobacteriaceae bacterium]
MKIYTKTGDSGSTGLFGGKRVSKDNPRIEAYGTIDELNSWMGLVRDQEVNGARKNFLASIQENLFVISSMLAAEPGNEKVKIPKFDDSAVSKLEAAMDEMNNSLPEMRSFVLPGGHQSVSFCHIARTVCRRAERRVVALYAQEEGHRLPLIYLNRLSDYLFVLARAMAHELGAEETPWKPQYS